MPEMILLSVGDRIQPGTCTMHSRFARVVNFTQGELLVGLVEQGIGAGPLNIVVKDADMYGVSHLEIEPWCIVLDKQRHDFTDEQYYHSKLDFKRMNLTTFHTNLHVFKKLLIEISHPKSLTFLLDANRREHFRSGFDRAFMQHISRGVQQLHRGHIISGVKMLQGCGFGLTPSGDDFIAGLLLGLHCLQSICGRELRHLIDTVYAASRGTNIFSQTLLSLAKEGLLFESMKQLITALLWSGESEVLRGVEGLCAVGGSSGADIGTGFFMTVQPGVDGFRVA